MRFPTETPHFNAKHWLLILLAICTIGTEAFAKKDYKGLFGSFRREKFIENEGRSTSFGIDLSLSTLFPISAIVTNIDNSQTSNMHYNAFFNVEFSAFLNLFYSFQVYAKVGYFNFDSRYQSNGTLAQASPDTPFYNEFEMKSIPLMGGVKYRLSKSDLVPYIGIGVGAAYSSRRFYYDHAPTSRLNTYNIHLVGEVTGGFEFYFASRAGIRLEMSAFYMKLPEEVLNGTINLATITAKANPWAIRYASGIFILF